MTKIDPLEKYRHKAAPNATGPYEAYAEGAEGAGAVRLVVRLKFPQPSEALHYAALTNVIGDWRYGIGITLEYGQQIQVMIEGDNLQELLHALERNKVEWIQEFDATVWDENALRSDQPIIRSITIKTPATLAETAAPSQTMH